MNAEKNLDKKITKNYSSKVHMNKKDDYLVILTFCSILAIFSCYWSINIFLIQIQLQITQMC